MKIGDRIYVRGYVDEIRKDTVIIRNAGGYFGTIPSEVVTGELPSAEKAQLSGEDATKDATSDLISRQDAIEAVETKIKKWNAVDGEGYHVGLGLRYTDVIDTLTELPSAEPETPSKGSITCKDCRRYNGRPCGLVNWYNGKEDFCSRAEKEVIRNERRTL